MIKKLIMPGEIADSAFLKYEKTENKDNDYLKKIDAFSSQEMIRGSEGDTDKLKKDGILDKKDGEKIKKDFDEFLEKFSDNIGRNGKTHEQIGKISDKIQGIQEQKESYNSDFLELGKMISGLKSDLVEKNADKKEVTDTKENLTEKQKLEKLAVVNLDLDTANNKKFDEALKNPDGIGPILEGWLGKEKIKELFKIPFLGKILKGFIGLEDFKFSNKAEEGIGTYKIDQGDFKDIKNLDGLKTKLGKISSKNLKGVDKLILGIDTIQEGDGKKLVEKIFNDLAKYSNGIENFNSKSTEFSKDKKSASFEIKTTGAVDSIFLRKEINGEEGSSIGGKSDIVKIVTDTLKGKGDFSKKTEKIVNELKNTFDTDKLKSLFNTDGNIRVATIDENDKTKLNITFISSKELVKKSEEK